MVMKILRKESDWDGRERRDAESLRQLRLKKTTNRFQISNLRKRLLIYFILIIFVSLSVGIQLIYEVGSGRLQKQISENIGKQISTTQISEIETDGIKKILQRLQYRMILIMFIVFLCVVSTMFVFIRNIVEPLDAIGKAAKRIAEGHLDETVPIRNQDEIGQIGDLINDLSTNLQEILLHIWNHTGQDITLLDHINEVVNSQSVDGMPKEVKEEIAFVRQDIGDMQNMVKAFDFYNIQFQDGKVLANDKKEDARS